MLKLLHKLKPLLTGERADLATGEIIDVRKYEQVDPVPMAPPVGYRREPSLMEKIQMMVLKDKVDRLQEELGAETAEEANDFDIDDEDDNTSPSSPHEFERHEVELLMAMEKLQAKEEALTEKYGPLDPATGKRGVRGAQPTAEPVQGAPKAPAGPSAAASPPPSDET